VSLNIPLRVRNLVDRHDTSDPFQLAKELNCSVYLLDLPPTVNGFWKRMLRRRTIAINKNLPAWQQAAVLCHELGHIVCHPGYTAFSMRNASYSNTRIEREADEFAKCLMAYRYDLEEYYISQFLAEGWRA
jgi:hypothetical protein